MTELTASMVLDPAMDPGRVVPRSGDGTHLPPLSWNVIRLEPGVA